MGTTAAAAVSAAMTLRESRRRSTERQHDTSDECG
jgi:hypothetical protein